ncbi:BMP family ABC transporter substrate-binding protein [Ferrovibrio sp.]|uniref:BMP family ABC transporter substrate-binding protein n=1 Tax=Ferrovibrio sp. TaxID=1917215 RepID=UPI0025BACF7B|nr:BMP family ABC transporter substrate-binding protein [Ferrovibrio sp.]MBX3456158.1 BMP family ABC transporter substrate-binding protein [Ferrovibrio sp.]
MAGFDRRDFLKGSAAAAGLGILGGAVGMPYIARAAGPLTVGVLIPGSKSDKGWMESGYDGLKAAEAKFGGKIKVQFIENVKFGDMEQVLVALAGKNQMVIGVGGQTQGSVFKVAPRFSKVKFAIVGGNKDAAKPANVSSYDVRQAEIGFVAGAAAAMLSKNGAVSYVGGLEIPAIVNTGKEFGNGAKYINPAIKYFENYTGDFDDVAKSKEATLAAIAQGADVHYHILNLGLRGMEQAAREKNTKIIGSYTNRCGTDPLYIAYSITGVGFQVEYAIEQAVAGTWAPEFKPFGLAMGPKASDIAICGGLLKPDQLAKLEAIKKDILAGTIKVLEA